MHVNQYRNLWLVVGTQIHDCRMDSLRLAHLNKQMHKEEVVELGFGWLTGYLLLGNFGAHRDAETDGLKVPAAHGQVQRAALGLVQVVNVRVHRVSILLSCSSDRLARKV